MEAAINADPRASVGPGGHGTDADAGEYLQAAGDTVQADAEGAQD